MKLKATIDNIALAALVFAVVAIAAVSTVAVVSAESLIATNERILGAQRIISSLEAIRQNALALNIGEQNYIITGSERDLGPYRSGAVEIEAELVYLAGKRYENSALASQFTELNSLARQFIASERRIVDARKTQGFAVAQAMIRDHLGDEIQEKLLGTSHQILVSSRRALDKLEADQVVYGDKVRRLILALISSSAFILVFLYGTLRRLNREQKVAQARIAHQATHDSLTGLFNRRAVMDHISSRLTNAESEAALGGFALLLLDLDGFKEVNDNMGHDTGDLLLKEVARRTRLVLRTADYVSRLGGDEFLVVIPQVSDEETAAHVAEKLISSIADPYHVGHQRISVTASIGISMFPRDARDRETLMKCADTALYEAKHAGRNRAVFFRHGSRGGRSG
jgi:diguanylate cyclase (GGDEF)-like protein